MGTWHPEMTWEELLEASRQAVARPADFSGKRFQIKAPPGVTREDMDEVRAWLGVPMKPVNMQESKGTMMEIHHGHTRHGHPCCFEAPQIKVPFAKVPCGMTRCPDCQADLRKLHQAYPVPAVPANPYLDPERAAAYHEAQKTILEGYGMLRKRDLEDIHAMSGGSRCDQCNGNLDLPYEQGGWHAADCPYYQLRRTDNVNADLDEITSKWLAECGGCLGASGYGHTCNEGDPRPVIASLITEVRRLRALQLRAVNVRMPDLHRPPTHEERHHRA